MSKLEMTYGNRKLDKDTAILNIGSATNCAAKVLGLCKVCKICYAMKAERLYPNVKPYRNRQATYWAKRKAETIAADILADVSRKHIKVTKFRFSEAGDFRTQKDVDKMADVCRVLSSQGIKCYGYTARRDLKLGGLMKYASVQGSGFMATNEFRVVTAETVDKKQPICAGNCRICSLCVTGKNLTIQVIKH